jgi:branched-chain amino acid transport system substrate-binding protein
MPEFVRQMREAGMSPQIMGTAWGLDKPAYDALAALGVRLTGVSAYRYGHETDAPMINNMREYLAKNGRRSRTSRRSTSRPGSTGMIFAEVAERCLKANKPLTLPNMKAALESMKEWDTGGISGLLADLSTHQIPGRPHVRLRPGQEDDGAGERVDQGMSEAVRQARTGA